MKRKKNKTLPKPNEISDFVRYRDEKLDGLIDTLFSTMENLDSESKKLLFRSVLVPFLEKYSSIAEIGDVRRSQDIMSLFQKCHLEINECVEPYVSEMLSMFDGKCIIPIISRLVCLYATLGVSDTEGSKKCRNLAKNLISKKNRPELLALSVLKKRSLKNGVGIPNNEYELLNRYSF